VKGERWTKDQDQSLLQGLGTYGYQWFKARTGGRSKAAILTRASRKFQSGITRGAYTLNRIVKNTGYSRTQVLRAQDALKQKWKRTGPKGAYLITEEQLTEIVDWLQHDFWSKSKRRYCCSGCTSETRASYALGLCRRCYDRYRKECSRRGLPIVLEEQKVLFDRIRLEAFSGNHATFLDEIARQLDKGLALSDAQLDWLEMLRPGVQE